MPIHRITNKDFIEMPWKNGQGTTYQVDLESLHNQWLWRISMATIEKENTFSEFKNYNRLLTIIDGDGILLNQKALRPKQIIFFHGEEAIACQPILGKVKDLGVIYDRDFVSVSMDYLSFIKDQKDTVISQLFPLNFIYCLKGELLCENQKLIAGEFFKVSQQSKITFSFIAENTELYIIKILSSLSWGK